MTRQTPGRAESQAGDGPGRLVRYRDSTETCVTDGASDEGRGQGERTAPYGPVGQCRAAFDSVRGQLWNLSGGDALVAC